MREAVIVSTARTPIGRAYRGAFNMTHGADLGGHVIKHAVARAKIDPAEVEDAIMGCGLPERATGGNIARQAAIRAGLPVTVAGMTVNRFCSSGLQTIALAAQRIIAGEASIICAGGLESISLVQDGKTPPAPNEWMLEHKPDLYMPMIDTADNVAARYKVSRESQDEYALESQRRTATAQQAKKFDNEIVPMTTTKKIVNKDTKEETFERSHLRATKAIAPIRRLKASRRSSRCAKESSSRRAMPANSRTALRPAW
jgi:acetyl-CoA C-acetyltransferase